MAFRLQSMGKDDIKRDRIGTRKPRVRFINDRNPFRFAFVAFISLVLWRKIRVSRAVLDRDVAMVRLPDHAHARQSNRRAIWIDRVYEIDRKLVVDWNSSGQFDCLHWIRARSIPGTSNFVLSPTASNECPASRADRA